VQTLTNWSQQEQDVAQASRLRQTQEQEQEQEQEQLASLDSIFHLSFVIRHLPFRTSGKDLHVLNA
jgi:hypothetical protein